MKNILIISLVLALTACASQRSSEHTEQMVQQLSQLNQQQTAILSQCEVINEQLLNQVQRFDQLERQVVAIVPAPATVSQTKAKPTCNTTNYTLGNKTVIGEVEWVSLEHQQQAFQARIDTGAATSSLNAIDLVQFERDGKNWVRFNLRHDTIKQDMMIERPVIRTAEVIQSSSNRVDKRPVVSMLVKLGSISEKVQFTLTDRSHLSYPILLGRSFLKDIAVVDVSHKLSQPKPTFKD